MIGMNREVYSQIDSLVGWITVRIVKGGSLGCLGVGKMGSAFSMRFSIFRRISLFIGLI